MVDNKPTEAMLKRIDTLLADERISDEYIESLGQEKVRKLLQTQRGAGALIGMLKRRLEYEEAQKAKRVRK